MSTQEYVAVVHGPGGVGVTVTFRDGRVEKFRNVLPRVGVSGALHLERSVMELPEDRRPKHSAFPDVYAARVIPAGEWVDLATFPLRAPK